MPPVLFSNESYQSRSLPLSAQRLVNGFVEAEHPDAKAQLPLFGAPGLTAFSVCGSGPVRGLYNLNGVTYAVAGTGLFRIDPNGTSEQLGGSIISGDQVVSMSDNGDQLCIVNGVAGYIYTVSTNSLVQISDPNFYPADLVTYFDTYFVFNKKGTNIFFISNPNDGLTYDGLLFASAEAQSDLCIGCIENLELLFIFGQKHIEMWYDAGTSDFPFQRYAGGVIPYGCVAPHSLIKQDGAIFFLGSDGCFYRLQGNVAIRISTHPIETLVSEFVDVTFCQGMAFTIQGHKMVAFTFPQSLRTLVWDISTNRWHERESLNDQSVSYGRWRGNCAVQMPNQQILIGDQYSGAVGLMDWTSYTEFGNTIKMQATSVPFHSDKKRVFISRLEFDMEQGVGTTTGQGQNPVVMLEMSKDGGRTWVALQPRRSLGQIGRYATRQRYLRLGQSMNGYVFRATITDPVKRVLIQAHADITVGL